MSLLFGLSDTQGRKAFMDKCIKVYGVAPECIYASDFGDYVLIENLTKNTADRLRKEPEVENVFEDDSFQPFL